MQKINITLNLSKINKDKIVDRTYKDEQGNDVTEKTYKIEVIPLKAPKFITQGDTWIMNKTHFVVEAQTKEERNSNGATNYVGEGFEFTTKNPATE